MITSISALLLSQLSEFVAAQMGLHFPRERWRDLERGIGSAAREFDFKDAQECLQWLISSPLTRSQIGILARHLTVGETYFFREKKSFEILEEHVLPELIRTRQGNDQRLRIWSPGCCTGEEPYSIAISLSKVISDLQDWNITVLGTDLNPRSLQKAAEGVYSEWSFRGTPQWITERYFKKTKDGRLYLLPSIKKMVTLNYLNLAEDAYPSFLNKTNAMDVIFCRNVLMYFTPEVAKKVGQNLYRSLVDGGWLIVSPSETSHVLFSQFITVNFPGATLYKKDAHRPQTAEVLPYDPQDEPNVSIQPRFDSTGELHSEVHPPEPLSDLLHSDTEERNGGKPQPIAYGEALTLYEGGRYEKAAEKLVELSENRDDSKAMALLARVYANQGKLAEALEWCEKAIAADKMNAGCHYLRATILQEQGSAEEARASLKRTLYLDQDFVLAHFALGNLTLREAKLKESEKHFENALSLLSAYGQEEILPESEGITAGRLMEIIAVQRKQGAGKGRQSFEKDTRSLAPEPRHRERFGKTLT